MDNLVLKGDLKSLSIADLFELLRFKKGKILASFQFESCIMDFYFNDALVCWADLQGEIDPITSYLIPTGAISNEELIKYDAERNRVSPDSDLLDFLKNIGKISEREIERAVVSRIIDLGVRLSLVKDAEVIVTIEKELPSSSLKNPMSIDFLLLEIARRMDEEAALLNILGSLDLTIELEAHNLSDEVKFTGEEWSVLKQIDGKKTINNIIQSGGVSRLQVLKSMAGFINLGIIKSIVTDSRKPEVLVVDDSVTQRHLVSFVLNGAGFITREASDGETAIEMILSHLPDLIILDVILPGINGYEVCSRLKRNKLTTNVPIILLTSKTGFADKIKGKLARADLYLTKPFIEDELVQVSKKLAKPKLSTK